MSNPKIEHPKVFISFAWGSEEYQEKFIPVVFERGANPCRSVWI